MTKRKGATEVVERVARELVPEVTTIHNRDDVEPVPPTAPPRQVRWFLPRAEGAPTQHAYYVQPPAPAGSSGAPVVSGGMAGAQVVTGLGGANVIRSRCGGVRTEGGVYPPADDVPRCPSCIAGLADDAKALEEEANAGTE